MPAKSKLDYPKRHAGLYAIAPPRGVAIAPPRGVAKPKPSRPKPAPRGKSK